MSDKNIEIIKAIKATGKCSGTAVKPTSMIVEGLEANPSAEIHTTQIVFNASDDNKNK